MSFLRIVAARGLLFCLVATVAWAERWTTLKGETFEARLSGVYGPLAVFAEERGSRQLAVDALDDAGLARIADFVTRRPALPEWRTSSSAMAKALRGQLLKLEDRRMVAYEPAAGVAEPEIYLIFFGASWSEASEVMTPEVIGRYRGLKKAVGAKFELIYVGRDKTVAQHDRWVYEWQMPWPTLRFAERGKLRLLDRWDAGVPSLVALTPEGDVVLYSERAGGAPVTPTQVLAEFGSLLGMMADESPAGKRAKHRLAVLLHVRAHPSGQHAPQPYVLSLDRNRYQTLEHKRVTATLELDEKGQVTNASFEPAPGAVHQEQFTRDSQRWLFLPAVSNGAPRAFTVQLPIEF